MADPSVRWASILGNSRQTYLPEDGHADILDLMAVASRVGGAHVFHGEKRRHLLRASSRRSCTAGRYRHRQLATQGDAQGLTGQEKGLRALAFLEKNKHRMRYDAYLRLGCPVATGVIEGACRHVIKDRMERADMRWKIPGAQAMLDLRTIRTNGDWTTFQDFRIALENERLYPNTKALEGSEWTAFQAA